MREYEKALKLFKDVLEIKREIKPDDKLVDKNPILQLKLY